MQANTVANFDISLSFAPNLISMPYRPHAEPSYNRRFLVSVTLVQLHFSKFALESSCYDTGCPARGRIHGILL